MPKIGPSEKTVNKILKVLKKVGKNGIWIHELARQTKIPVSTIHWYLRKIIKDKIIIKPMSFGGIETRHIMIVKLKEFDKNEF